LRVHDLPTGYDVEKLSGVRGGRGSSVRLPHLVLVRIGVVIYAADNQTRKAVHQPRRFHFYTGDAQLLGQRVNYWPALTSTVAKSLIGGRVAY
jgi:hypothetical protein